MGKIHTIIKGQTLLDISNRYAGTVEAVFEIAKYNNCSITTVFNPGQLIKIPPTFENFNAEVVAYFDRKNTQLASYGSNA